MSRILKRPMFRTGGTPNEGIMHGLVDRRGYDNGGQAEKYADEYYKMLSKYKPPAPRLPLGQVGLNLVSGDYAGDGFLSNVARSVREPYSQWTQADDATRNLDYQARMSAAKMGISKDEAERLAMIKAKKDASNMQKDYTVERQYMEYIKDYTDRPEAKMNWTEENIFPHAFATLRSEIKLGAANSSKGQALWRKFVGVLPNKKQSGAVKEWKYDEMNAGAIYFHPDQMAFFQKVPRDGDEPAHVLKIDPYTFEVIEKKVLAGLE